MLDLPNAVPSKGTRRVVFIPGTVGNIDAITVAELTNGANISCYIAGPSGWNATQDQTTINDPRYCSIEDLELPGTKTRTLALTYTTNLHEAAEDEARLALPEGAEGVLVHLMQVEAESDTFASGDFYEAVRVRAGEPVLSAAEDNAVDRINQKMFRRGPWRNFKKIAA